MQLITTNGPEHRALIIQAIHNQESHLLEQLREIASTGKPYIRLLDGFGDDLMNTGTDETKEEQEERFSREYDIVLSKEYFMFLYSLDNNS